jgi:hypothetical protein
MGELHLTKGRVAIVDDADLEWLSAFKWYVGTNGYATRWRRREEPPGSRDVRLHRFITGALPAEVVDHANGDPLDNRRSNLRICSTRQNGQNRRPPPNVHCFIGIRRRLRGCREVWIARVRGQTGTHESWHPTALDAAKGHDDLARLYHGPFAILNFPNEGERGL